MDRMSPKKARINSSQPVHKLRTDFVNRERVILTLILNGYYGYNQIRERTGLSKRKIEYTISKLVESGRLKDKTPKSNKYKVYSVTDDGISFLGEARTTDAKLHKLVSENVRAKCEILKPENLMRLLNHDDYNFKENLNWKNSKQYIGKINNQTVQVNVGKTSSLIIIAKQEEAKSGALLGYLVIRNIVDTTILINKKWDVGLSVPELYSGEYIVNSPYAEAVMEKTHGKQVKGRYSLVNQSAPIFIPHQEFKDPLDVDKVLQTPYDIERINSNISKISDEIEFIRNESNFNKTNTEQLGVAVQSMSNAMNDIVSNQKNQNEKLSKLTDSNTIIAEKMTELLLMLSPHQVKNSSQQVTNSDVNRMFG